MPYDNYSNNVSSAIRWGRGVPEAAPWKSKKCGECGHYIDTPKAKRRAGGGWECARDCVRTGGAS